MVHGGGQSKANQLLYKRKYNNIFQSELRNTKINSFINDDRVILDRMCVVWTEHFDQWLTGKINSRPVVKNGKVIQSSYKMT